MEATHKCRGWGIKAGGWALIGEGDNGCGLEAHENSALVEGKVKDGGENISQIVGTCFKGMPQDIVWSCCLTGVDLSLCFLYLVC